MLSKLRLPIIMLKLQLYETNMQQLKKLLVFKSTDQYKYVTQDMTQYIILYFYTFISLYFC